VGVQQATTLRRHAPDSRPALAQQRHPGKTALTHLGAGGEGVHARSHDFTSLVDQVACRAALLAARGVQPGDRVALLGANDDRLVMALFACWWLGAVACPLHVRWSAPDLLERALAAWPQAEFFQAYGLSETAGAEIIVADPAGRELPAGEVGEVLCRGPMVTPGYWRNPQATAAAFTKDGWFRTGDAGRMRADGALLIVDRLKDMIISGGENVYRAEVESVLREHPAVAQAAVVGVPDTHWGEAVQAFVVLRQPTDKSVGDRALRAWCRERLAGYKCPRGFHQVAELPLSAAGKVLKQRLRELAQEKSA